MRLAQREWRREGGDERRALDNLPRFAPAFRAVNPMGAFKALVIAPCPLGSSYHDAMLEIGICPGRMDARDVFAVAGRNGLRRQEIGWFVTRQPPSRPVEVRISRHQALAGYRE